jgi:hypothetical protein
MFLSHYVMTIARGLSLYHAIILLDDGSEKLLIIVATLQVTMIWIVILIEHIILATKFVYSVAIEDAPDWVQRSRDGIAAMK